MNRQLRFALGCAVLVSMSLVRAQGPRAAENAASLDLVTPGRHGSPPIAGRWSRAWSQPGSADGAVWTDG